MEFKNTAWAIILFSLVIISVGVIISERATEYGSSISSDLDSDFNKLESISTSTESMYGNINPQSGEASSDPEAGIFKGGYGIISSIGEPFRVVFGEDGIIQSASERWGIPNYLIQGFVAMFMLGIIFGIIAVVFRLGRSSA